MILLEFWKRTREMENNHLIVLISISSQSTFLMPSFTSFYRHQTYVLHICIFTKAREWQNAQVLMILDLSHWLKAKFLLSKNALLVHRAVLTSHSTAPSRTVSVFHNTSCDAVTDNSGIKLRLIAIQNSRQFCPLQYPLAEMQQT